MSEPTTPEERERWKAAADQVDRDGFGSSAAECAWSCVMATDAIRRLTTDIERLTKELDEARDEAHLARITAARALGKFLDEIQAFMPANDDWA